MITIDPLFKSYDIPVELAWLEADVTIRPSDPNLLQEIEQTIQIICSEKHDHDLPQMQAIQNTRQAYKKLGKDPSRYRPAAEALRRRVMQGKGLFQINNITDINNLISLRTGISIGTYDKNTLHPPIILVRADENDVYEGIGRGPLNLTNLPVLKDKKGAFGCPTSDSTRSMIQNQTTEILMVLYLFGKIRPDWNEVENLLRTHADGRLRIFNHR